MASHEVLVVDDDRDIVEVVSAALKDEGYRVRQAYDGLAALEEVERSSPDLVVADIVMPRLDGVELARRLLARQEPVPVVLVSAARDARAAAGQSFVAKPFDIDRLLATVAGVLGDSAASAVMSEVGQDSEGAGSA